MSGCACATRSGPDRRRTSRAAAPCAGSSEAISISATAARKDDPESVRRRIPGLFPGIDRHVEREAKFVVTDVLINIAERCGV